jgi:hypothetical protein
LQWESDAGYKRENSVKSALYLIFACFLISSILSCAKKELEVKSPTAKADTVAAAQSQPATIDTVPRDTVTPLEKPNALSVQEVIDSAMTILVEVKIFVSNALASCKNNTGQTDSIAIALCDTLNSFGDRFYDLYYSCVTQTNDSLAGLLDTLNKNGITTAQVNNMLLFKANLEFIVTSLKGYLSEAGKAFFKTRANDQFQSSLYDDAIILLPWDTLAERLQRWDSFCTAHENTYAGKRGEEYVQRYLGMYLSTIIWNSMYYEQFLYDSSSKKSYVSYIQKYASSRTGKIVKEYFSLKVTSGAMVLESFLSVYRIPTSLFILWLPGYTSEILEPTNYHSSEVDKKQKLLSWLALVNTNNKWSLTPIKPSFKKCWDPINDNGLPGETTGVCISVPMPGVKYLLFDKNMSAGPVSAVYNGEKPPLPKKDSSIIFSLEGKTYRLISKSKEQLELIFLEHNGNRDFLFNPFRNGETNAALLWAGDLDDDNNIDIVLDASEHYNCSDLKLLLSKDTKPGELFRWAAHLSTQGD